MPPAARMSAASCIACSSSRRCRSSSPAVLMLFRNQSTPLPTHVTVTTSPSLNLRTSASHLVSSTVTSRWYSAKRAMVPPGRPNPLLVGDAQVLVELGHERNRLHADLFEQVHGGGVALKAFRELVQTLGDLRQDLRRGFHLARRSVEIDAHPAQGSPRLFAFPEIVVGRLGQTAHQALDNQI